VDIKNFVKEFRGFGQLQIPSTLNLYSVCVLCLRMRRPSQTLTKNDPSHLPNLQISLTDHLTILTRTTQLSFSLPLLVPTSILFEGKAAYKGGRSEMEGRTGCEVEALSRSRIERNQSIKARRGIACSFWVGSAPSHERRPFPAHLAPRDMLMG
jgi:hypothetical protein